MSGKIMTMKEAIHKYVNDGETVYAGGFTHLLPFAAGHEIIRQQKRNLTLARATPDLIYDQMIGAGCAKKVIFSWAGNPGVGSLRCFRRAFEKGIPNNIDIEEYSHFGMSARLYAGASGLPFMILRNYMGSDIPTGNENIKTVKSPYGDEILHTVPALNPDVAIIHAQRADEEGNVQIWGVTGVQKEAVFASLKVIVSVEEIVDSDVIRSDPNRTLIPSFKVDAIVEESFGAHPSYTQGYYDRDNEFYVAWDKISKDEESFRKYLEEWVYGVENREEYVKKLGKDKIEKLMPGKNYSKPVNYGDYR